MKSTLPDPIQEAIRDVVFPSDPPEDNEREVEAKGHTLTLRRRGEDVELILDGRDAEEDIRRWFGHDSESIADQTGATVRGFILVYERVDGQHFDEEVHDPEDIDQITLRIQRPTLIADIV